MRILLHNHQGKADGLERALGERGHTFSNDDPDVILCDHDGPEYYRSVIEQGAAHGVPTVLYSHGATSYVAWDGLWQSHPAVAKYLAISRAEKAIMQQYGYPKPIEVIGWYWSELSTPRKVTGRKVLFAPIHVLTNGFIPPQAAAANTAAYNCLLRAGVELTVRHLGSLHTQGLWIAPEVTYQEADHHMTDRIVEGYDLVVSYGSLAYLAVARGIATRMYAQGLAPWDGYTLETMRTAAHFEQYRTCMEYPYSVEDASGLFEFDRPEALAQWKAEHIGNPLRPEHLESLLEQVIRDAHG